MCKPFCPQPYNETCYNEGDWQNGYFYTVPAWAGLISSLLSVVGCLLMLISYQKYRDFRTGSRKVATWLSVSNLFLAIGYAVGSLNLIIFRYSPDQKYCSGFSYICQAQALVTWSSALASFIWTVILALYLFVALVKRSINAANHWLAWIAYYAVSLVVPIVIMGSVAGIQRLGYSPYATGGTCFISTGLNKTGNDSDRYGFELQSVCIISLIKFLEVTSYVIVVFFFGVIQYKIITLPSMEQVCTTLFVCMLETATFARKMKISIFCMLPLSCLKVKSLLMGPHAEENGDYSQYPSSSSLSAFGEPFRCCCRSLCFTMINPPTAYH